MSRPDPSSEDLSALRNALDIAACPDISGRACGPACRVTCPECGATACSCAYTPACPDAQGFLSAACGGHDVERAVLPLVFAMKRMRLFSPIQSCGGHLGPDGTIARMPYVWFTCAAPVHAALLTNGIRSLRFDRLLSVPWQVVNAAAVDDFARVTGSLQPDLSTDDARTLSRLRDDMRVIADTLEEIVVAEAAEMKDILDAPDQTGG